MVMTKLPRMTKCLDTAFISLDPSTPSTNDDDDDIYDVYDIYDE